MTMLLGLLCLALDRWLRAAAPSENGPEAGVKP
jgi:hypothetical protein